MKNVPFAVYQDRQRVLFSKYLAAKEPFLDLKESKEIQKLVQFLDEDTSIPSDIQKAMASLDREDLINLGRQVRAYEALAKVNQETDWQAQCARDLSQHFFKIANAWRKPSLRSVEAREKLENKEATGHFVSPGSLADQQAKKEKLLAKIKWEKDYLEKTGSPLPKRWKKSKNQRSNKSCRGSAGLEHL